MGAEPEYDIHFDELAIEQLIIHEPRTMSLSFGRDIENHAKTEFKLKSRLYGRGRQCKYGAQNHTNQNNTLCKIKAKYNKERYFPSVFM